MSDTTYCAPWGGDRGTDSAALMGIRLYIKTADHWPLRVGAPASAGGEAPTPLPLLPPGVSVVPCLTFWDEPKPQTNGFWEIIFH